MRIELGRIINGCVGVVVAMLMVYSVGAVAVTSSVHSTAAKLYPLEQLGSIKKAALSGDADAQYALGYLLYYGKGVTQNKTTALSWIRKAAAQGQPQAAKALAILQPSNTPVVHQVTSHARM